jgi:hypothetical protein
MGRVDWKPDTPTARDSSVARLRLAGSHAQRDDAFRRRRMLISENCVIRPAAVPRGQRYTPVTLQMSGPKGSICISMDDSDAGIGVSSR